MYAGQKDSPSHAMTHYNGLRHLERIQYADDIVSEALNTLLDLRVGRASGTRRVECDASKVVSLQT